MFTFCKDSFIKRYVCLLISLYCVRLSNSKNVENPCDGEKEDAILKILLSDVIFTGSVDKIFSLKNLESCAEFENVEFLKGNLDESPLRICSVVDLECHDSFLDEGKQFIIFLTSTEPSVDDETNDNYYLIDSSPLPFSRKSEIETLIADAFPGQSPVIKVLGKTLVNESHGDKVNLTCSFSGYPLPEVKWLKNGEEMFPSHDVKITTNESHSVVEFTELYIDHAGEYQCIAKNVLGSDNITFTVTSYKMHAHLCPDNEEFCFNHGICYFNQGQKLCVCKLNFIGTRCQLFGGESKEKSNESTKSLQTLLLIATVAIVTTGVIILVYYSVRSLYLGKSYKKIQANGSTQLLQRGNIDATRMIKPNGDIPEIKPQEIAPLRASLNSPRTRLNGISTFVHSNENIWKSKGEQLHEVQVEIDNNDAIQTPALLSSFVNKNNVHGRNASSNSVNIPMKVTII